MKKRTNENTQRGTQRGILSMPIIWNTLRSTKMDSFFNANVTAALIIKQKLNKSYMTLLGPVHTGRGRQQYTYVFVINSAASSIKNI